MQVIVEKPLGSHDVLYVEFNWPLEVANGKWLLYIEDIKATGTDILCSPKEFVNPQKFQVSHGL